MNKSETDFSLVLGRFDLICGLYVLLKGNSKESTIYSPEIAKAGSQYPQLLRSCTLSEPVMTVMEEYLENNLCSTNSKIFQFFEPNSLCLSTINTVYIPSGIDGQHP